MNKIFNFFVIILMIFSSQLLSQNSYQVYFNEVKSDDGGTGQEFVELIGPAGTEITGLIIIHYNGSESQDSDIFNHTIGTFTIPFDDCNVSMGFYVLGDAGVLNSDALLPVKGLQNGPDGLILYDTNEKTILDAIAWQGAGDMTTNDPGTVSTGVSTSADNYLHVTIDDDHDDYSLSAPDNVLGDDGRGWELITATPGAINTNQLCADIALPVELSSFTAEAVSRGVLLSWTTESEIENLGFILERKTSYSDWNEIVSYKNDVSLLGQGTVSNPTDYEYIDKLVQQGNTYEYRLADVDYKGVVTYHATREVYVESNPLATNADKFTVTAHPNPFNPSTTIGYNIPSVETRHTLSVRVEIYDINGKLITTLVNKEQSAGWYEIKWNGKNKIGKAVPAGAYLSRVTFGNEVKTTKLMLLR